MPLTKKLALKLLSECSCPYVIRRDRSPSGAWRFSVVAISDKQIIDVGNWLAKAFTLKCKGEKAGMWTIVANPGCGIQAYVEELFNDIDRMIAVETKPASTGEISEMLTRHAQIFSDMIEMKISAQEACDELTAMAKEYITEEGRRE